MNMTAREEAIDDCKWALNLSETAYNQHVENWCHTLGCDTEYEVEYTTTIREIMEKRGTAECLLSM